MEEYNCTYGQPPTNQLTVDVKQLNAQREIKAYDRSLR